MNLLLFLLVISRTFVSGDDCETCTALLGGGPSAPAPMIRQLAFAYSLLKDKINIDYNLTTGPAAYEALKQLCRKDHLLDFVVTDVNYPLVTGYSYLKNDNMLTIPFFVGAMVLPYSLPEISWDNGEKLILSRSVIWKIYSYQILYWDDPSIKALNAAFQDRLPHNRIILVFQNGTNGNNVMIQTLLFNVANTTVPMYSKYWFPLANVTIDPSNFTEDKAGGPYVRWGINDFGAVSKVLTEPYTLGYAPLALVDQAGIAYASIINKKNNPVEATADSLAAAVRGANATAKGNITLISNRAVTDSADPEAYTFTALMYIAYWQNVNTNCAARRELWKWFHWILTDPTAEAQVTASIGYAPFFPEFKTAMLNRLKNVSCQGQKLLDLEYRESSSTPLRQTVLSIAAILATLTVTIMATLSWKRNNRITRAAGLAFALSFLIGCLLNYLSIFVWVLIPDSDRICSSRYLLVTLGYTLLLGSMFAKCWEISKAFTNAQTGDSLGAIQELTWWQFCRVFFLVVGINVLLLIVMASIDSPKSLVIITDPLELYAIHICYVWKTKEWVIVEFLYFSLLGVWGGYLAYKTRNIWEKYNYPNESKSILISIYNLTFCVVILVPLASSLTTDIEVVFFLTSAAIVFPTTFALLTVYGPKITAFLGSSFNKRSKNSDGHPNSHKSKQAASPTLRGMNGKDERKVTKINSNDNLTTDLQEEKGLIIVEDGQREHSEERGTLRNEVPQSPSTPEQRLLKSVIRSSSGTPLQQTALASQVETPGSPDDEDGTTKRRLQFIAEVHEADDLTVPSLAITAHTTGTYSHTTDAADVRKPSRRTSVTAAGTGPTAAEHGAMATTTGESRVATESG